jgi:hypothetical protein
MKREISDLIKPKADIIRYVDNDEFEQYWFGNITWLELLTNSRPERKWASEKEIKILIPEKKD